LEGEGTANARKRDPSKMAIATRLRKETTLTIKSIALRLSLGTSKCANAQLRHWMQNPTLGAAKADEPL